MEKKFYQTNLFISLMVTFLGLLVVCICFGIVVIIHTLRSSNYINKDIQKVPTITISGVGDVYAKPDIGLVTLSVVTEAKTVAQAMTENTSKMNGVISFVKKQGVEEKDLKTTNFNISPRYEYNSKTGVRTLVGYEITQSLQAKIRDLSKIGAILEGATEFGANEVGNLQFTIDDEDALKIQAREEAIKEAKSKAESLAKQLGVKLVRIVNFSESGSVPYPYYKTMSLETIGAAGETPQIETGENKISITVSIIYEIN